MECPVRKRWAQARRGFPEEMGVSEFEGLFAVKLRLYTNELIQWKEFWRGSGPIGLLL